MKSLRLVLLCAWAGGGLVRGGDLESLDSYRAELARCRAEHGGSRDLPDVRFFLFGMGPRAKLLYRDGRLTDAITGATVREWRVKGDVIVPCDYRVRLETTDGAAVVLAEDEQGVWIEVAGARTLVAGTGAPVKLPAFEGHRFPRVLRVLHQELLVNVTTNGPVPNCFVYPKPWYRDGAMMALALRETGNADLLRDWIGGLREPFDLNNAGVTEPDNLGQALFLASLAGGTNHPLVSKVLAELPRFEQTNAAGKFISGKSDFAEHPVYQTKWLKFGLRSLGLPDAYSIPSVADSYSALFWMDYRDLHVAGGDSDNRMNYPYLGWACDHFHGVKKSPLGNRDYPLTWERNASQARYEGMRAIAPVYVEQKLSVPHTWHAAEAFLLLLGEKKGATDKAAAAKPSAPAAARGPDFTDGLSAKLEPTRTVVFKKVNGRELHLNIFEPPGLKPGDRRPCFLSIHGGGWTGLSPRRQYPTVAHFAAKGMVGISVEYRLVQKNSGSTVADCVRDARSAARYVRAHAAELGVDPQKIIANGGSAGGHLAAGTALFDGVDEAGEDMSVSCVPNALVLFFPVIDTSAEGYGQARIGAQWQELSPLHRVKPGTPPTMIFHGTGDTVTPFKGAKEFQDAMAKEGNRCELAVHDGGVHGYLMRDRTLFEDTLRRTEAFLSSLQLMP